MPLDRGCSVVILTGGAGSRLGGVDKAMLDIGGSPLLDRVLADLPAAVEVVVAGPERPVPRPVDFALEDPPGGGPAAGAAAALARVTTPLVGILAVDVPTGPSVLVSALASLGPRDDIDVVVPIDPDGREQVLCAAWRTASLRSALAREPDWHGRPVRRLLDGMRILRLPMAAGDLADIDTPEDLERARRRWPSTESEQGRERPT